MAVLHRYRSAFMAANGLIIVVYAALVILFTDAFLGWLGFTPGNTYLEKVMGWYLVTFGIGALLAARAPEHHPVVVAMVGLEKIGPAVGFTAYALSSRWTAPLVVIVAADVVLAVLLLGYSAWLGSGARGEHAPVRA
jgi:hypothetical protein